MLGTLRQRKVVRVVFDEFHGEAWTIRPQVARGAARAPLGLVVRAAAAAPASAISRSRHRRRAARPRTLAAADVLVIAHPSEAAGSDGGRLAAPLGRGDDAIGTFVAAAADCWSWARPRRRSTVTT